MEDIPVLHIQSEKLSRKLIEDFKKDSRLILSKCSEIAAEKGLFLNTKLLQGNTGSTILDFCEIGKFDVIVTGDRGMGKFKELVLGSISSKVVHHALSCCNNKIR
jgi:nucleotide-binding universal stress UspA family protein